MRALVFFSFLLAGSLSASFVLAAEKIDVNSADLEDLIKIIHIGEVRALELISLRPFSSLDDLVRIKGISEKRVRDIKNQGLAWTDSQEVEPPLTEAQSEDSATPAENLTEVEPQSVEPQITEEIGKEELAAVGEQVAQSSTSLVPFLIAALVAAFSGAMIFLLKKKIKVDL